MSKKVYRKEKTCLNCLHLVENKFCSNCGQENTDTRKTFHHLFLHFFEDLTHYENAFWRTIKNLLFKPAVLSIEYLAGKRLSYLAPVRLYIFISFVTFFFISTLPDDHKQNKDEKTNVREEKIDKDKSLEAIKINQLFREKRFTKKEADTFLQLIKKNEVKDVTFHLNNVDYKSTQQLDSIQRFGKPNQKLSKIKYWFVKNLMKVTEKNNSAELQAKIQESFLHNFPKVLIIYMPLFAFFLWLFHNKKRWYYFDHGIFTLHYFSFLLLLFLLLTIINKITFLIFGENKILNLLSVITSFISIACMFYYFFAAHHRFYGECKRVSFIKSFFLFFINIFFIIVILLAFLVYSIISIH